MIVRLGNAFYWIAIVLAVGWFLWAIRLTAPSSEWGLGLGIGVVGSLVIWLIGGALRYLMAGR